MVNIAKKIEPTIEESWGDIDSLTATMHDSVQQEAWNTLVELAATRHDKVVAHFNRFPVSPENASFYRQHLAQLIKGETQLKDIVIAARREIMRQGVSQNHNRRAVNAYRQQPA